MSYPYPGYGQMPMPMPLGPQNSLPYQPVSTTPYPSGPTGSPYPTNIQQQSSITFQVDQWMNELVQQLTALLKDAPRTELDQLVNNEDKIISLVEGAEQTRNLQKKLQDYAEENKDQAVKNITIEPEIEIRKTTLAELAEKQNNLKERHTELQRKLTGLISLDSISAILQAAASEKESESDKISQEFLDGTKTVDEFLEEYIPERTVYQLRKVKSEKMTQLLRTGAVSVTRPTPMPRPMQAGGYGGYGGY